MKAIEIDFPFEQIDAIAEMESWRKEIHRPIYYIHKWWAKRLGSVFRAIILGVVLDEEQNIWSEFYKTHNFEELTILDPFMGSGTTLGECAKLGIKPIGCDTNPVSTFMVRQALARIDEVTLLTTFQEIEHDVKDRIQKYYKTLDPLTDKECDALYYFWVKIVETPQGEEIPLFKNYVFSQNAYPSKDPIAKIICPHCWTINRNHYNTREVECTACGKTFNPHQGSATDQFVMSRAGQRYKIKDLLINTGSPPKHRLYAIMAVNPEGEKVYLTPSQFDHQLFQKAQDDFRQNMLNIPLLKLRDGYNTKQAIGYGYRFWHQFFNERQLLTLNILLNRILQIEEQAIREHFLCLFSSTLEFNNLFCSFKGEGTGAVRHIFSHHILKPEKTPLENIVWGTEKSSGTFSTLFKSRLLNAKKYLHTPFEIRMSEKNGIKTTTREICSQKIDLSIVNSYESFLRNKKAALIMNGDSAHLPLPNNSVDAIITDPPYFDFVHYSELSDFFYAWLQIALKDSYHYFAQEHSSHPGEVQDRDPEKFSLQLGHVFAECFRVLKDQGLMVFSFHHSKPEAWCSIYQAIMMSQFSIIASHPVKAEMAVSKIKAASKKPINLDAIIVCKKHIKTQSLNSEPSHVLLQAQERYKTYCRRLWKAGRVLSENDKYVILSSQILVYASQAGLNATRIYELLNTAYKSDFSQHEKSMVQNDVERAIDFWKEQLVTEQTSFAFMCK
ncbi:MAG: DNA methyltransferase [Candidatus Vecturithrix sp.]|jgi:putative DNA methylase|nr:DNA methyltransferase [Candidatus Vecturithrix sp.]